MHIITGWLLRDDAHWGALTGNKTGEKNLRQFQLLMHVLVGTKVLLLTGTCVKACFDEPLECLDR